MHGRRCGPLLAVWLFIACAPVALRGQVSYNGTHRVQGQPVSVRPQVWAGPDSAFLLPPLPLPRRSPGSAPGSVPPGTISFPKMARAAGTIFLGTVTKIESGPERGGSAIATVAVTFHVERGLRGATAGESFTILQWLGLWSGGQQYQVGERVLLLLYPPSKLGLTSAVAGAVGQFRVDAAGRILLSGQQLAAFRGSSLLTGPSLIGSSRAEPLLTGPSRIAFNDFVQALHQAMEEERE
jgi:hypothetical protein